jgi:acetyl esterase/lipase
MRSIGRLVAVAFAGLAWHHSAGFAADQDPRPVPYVGAEGESHLAPIVVPFSSFASAQARQAFVGIFSGTHDAPPDTAAIETRRAYYDRFNSALAARAKELYPVKVKRQTIGGVPTEIITPADGISPQQQGRVLINLHGGAFLWGEGSGGEVEAVPIAGLGKITVITVGYREGPEYKFPAASEDVASVYRALLKQYRPESIGIYGCSAGGILTAQALAWFQKEHLPTPGAAGVFCASVGRFGGDSSYLGPAITAQSPLRGSTEGNFSFTPYFSDASLSDPLVVPMNSKDVLARFPPTLLIAGSRDFTVSSVMQADIELTKAGVETELHIWDGMWHSFFSNPDLPESKEMYSVVVKFFERHLRRTLRTRVPSKQVPGSESNVD